MLLLLARPSSALELRWTTGATDLSFSSATRCTLVVEADPLEVTLAGPAAVNLAVFDLQGRRVATLLDRLPMSTGEHVVPLPTVGWRAGCYLAHLDVDGIKTTRKMVVLR